MSNDKQVLAPTILKGAVAELQVTNELLRHGFYVFRSVSATAPFDLVAYDRGRDLVWRIEVRSAQVYTTNDKETKYSFGQKESDMCDIYATYIHEENVVSFFDKDRNQLDFPLLPSTLSALL